MGQGGKWVTDPRQRDLTMTIEMEKTKDQVEGVRRKAGSAISILCKVVGTRRQILVGRDRLYLRV